MEEFDNFRALAENANDGILVATSSGKYVYANKRASIITGYSTRELLKITMHNLVHPAEIKKIGKRLKNRLEGKRVPRQYEMVMVRKDGTSVPVEITGAKTYWQDEPASIVIIRDIEERKKREKQLRESEERYRTLMESIRDGVFILNKQGRVTFVNDVIVKKIGQPREWLLGKSYIDVIRPEHHDLVRKNNEATLRGKKNSIYELAYTSCSDEQAWVEVNMTALRDNKGITGLLGITRDITDRKLAEKRLEKARAELEDKVHERTAALTQREVQLEIKTADLEEMNAALRVLLKKRDEDKEEIQDNLLFNLKNLIHPYLQKLKSTPLDERQGTYLDIVESNMNDLFSPFSRNLSFNHSSLTPREIQVTNHIKEGKTTKEIANILSLSEKTIEGYRKNIRKKLGITNNKTNLKAHLISLH